MCSSGSRAENRSLHVKDRNSPPAFCSFGGFRRRLGWWHGGGIRREFRGGSTVHFIFTFFISGIGQTSLPKRETEKGNNYECASPMCFGGRYTWMEGHTLRCFQGSWTMNKWSGPVQGKSGGLSVPLCSRLTAVWLLPVLSVEATVTEVAVKASAHPADREADTQIQRMA